MNTERSLVSQFCKDFCVSNGTCVSHTQNARIFHSVVGLRSWVAEGAVIEDALLMGADYYEVNKLLD